MKPIVLSFLVAMLSSCNLIAQDFTPESAQECFDRFQSMYLKVSRSYAVLGSAKQTSIDMPNLSKTYEWFAVEVLGTNKSPRQFYSESKLFYPHAPDSNVWEKRYINDKKVSYSYGDFLTPVKELEQEEDEEEELYLRRAAIGCPNLFAISVLSFSDSTLLADKGKLLRTLNGFELFQEERKGNDFFGRFYGSNFVSEIWFSKASGYMPTLCKTFFYTPQKAAAPTPDQYKVLWSEIESQWENVGDDTWVPIQVSNITHRTSRNSKRGVEVQGQVKWDLKINSSLLTEKSVALMPMDGPLAEIRSKLLKPDKQQQPSRR